VANFNLGKKGETMKHNLALLRTIGLIAAMSNLCPFPKCILFVSIALTPLPILFLAGKLLGDFTHRRF